LRLYGVPDFWQETDYVIKEASFDYLGVRHLGVGLLTWAPAKGFRLELLLKRSRKLPSPIRFGVPRVIGPKDHSCIRLKLRDQGYAVTAPLAMDDALAYQIVSDDRVSVDPRSVSFLCLPGPLPQSEWWSGSALLDVDDSRVHWPDLITQKTALDGEDFGESFSRSGLSYRTCSTRVVGRYQEGRHFRVSWSLDRRRYSRAECWRFAEALQDALRAMLGSSVWLLQRETLNSPRRRLERRSPVKMQSIEFPLVEEDVLHKERLFRLTEFFLKGGPETRVAQKIVSQMLRASRQVTWADEQLLLSTILEATLRACDPSPWPKRSPPIRESLSRFRQRYGLGSKDWSFASRHAVSAFEHLRHPTAHPDWRLDERDPARAADRARALGEMAFLGRFYGYMILAMAGVPDLEPIFQGRRVDQVRDQPRPDQTPRA
jgi:hypothetical protein